MAFLVHSKVLEPVSEPCFDLAGAMRNCSEAKMRMNSPAKNIEPTFNVEVSDKLSFFVICVLSVRVLWLHRCRRPDEL